MEEKREEEREKALLREFEKYGETFIDGLVEKAREVVGDDPTLTHKVLEAVLSGARRRKKAIYESKRVHGVYSLPPRFRPYFEIARDYAYSKGWIRKNTDAQFANFCIRVAVENILKWMKSEEATLAQMAKESEQSEGESDKSRESEKDSQR